MLVQAEALPTLTRLAYTAFDVGLVPALILTIVMHLTRLAKTKAGSAARSSEVQHP